MNKTKMELILKSAISQYEEVSRRKYDPNMGWAQALGIADKTSRETTIFILGGIAILNRLLGR